MLVTDNCLSENEKGGFPFINLIATIPNSVSLLRLFLFSGETI